MANIIHKKGSLFDAPKGSMLIHAVSTRSVWGSGIAKQFKPRFPESFQFYKDFCEEEGSDLLGIAMECPEENGYTVVNLVTSIDYGDKKDSKDEILANTRRALDNFIWVNGGLFTGELHSCKFNSGLFGVPWEETEKVLIAVLDKYGYTNPWTVWEQ